MRIQPPLQRRCGTCKHYNAVVSKTGQRMNRHHSRCEWTGPEPIIPDAARVGYGAFKWPPQTTFMAPTSGTECPCWEPWK